MVKNKETTSGNTKEWRQRAIAHAAAAVGCMFRLWHVSASGFTPNPDWGAELERIRYSDTCVGAAEVMHAARVKCNAIQRRRRADASARG